MSKGPGKIERAIESSLLAEPDQAPTTEELCEIAYPGVNRIEKKHRVSVLRAAPRICERIEGWQIARSGAHGGTLVLWSRYSLVSYALMRIKTDWLVRYRTNDPRMAGCNRFTAEQAHARIEPGGRYHDQVVEGGAWWRHVQLWIADRDGDTSDRIRQLRADQERTDAQARLILARPLR